MPQGTYSLSVSLHHCTFVQLLWSSIWSSHSTEFESNVTCLIKITLTWYTVEIHWDTRPFMDTKYVVKLSAACKRMNAVLPQNYVLRYLEDKSVPWGTKNGFPLLKLLSKIFCKWTVHMCCWWHMRCWRCQLLLKQSYCFPAYRPDSLYNEML